MRYYYLLVSAKKDDPDWQEPHIVESEKCINLGDGSSWLTVHHPDEELLWVSAIGEGEIKVEGAIE